jgi:hypothetical protein
MKRILTLLVFIAILISSYAQDSIKKDTAWKAGGMFALTVSQAGFDNWAAGGENSYSANGRIALFGNYEKENTLWENNLDMGYGRANQGNIGLRKTDDLLELNSKFGYKANHKWYYSTVLNARTQFAEGKKYFNNDSSHVTSEAFAPLYINLAIGMDYKPDNYTSVFLSPVNMKNTYVIDTKYAIQYSIDSAKQLKTGVGAIVKIKYEREVLKNVNFLTKLDLFANYLEFKNVEDIDVNWEVLVTMNVFKVLSINLNTHLIWDKDVKFEENSETSKIQFKEIFGAGIAYKF